MTWGGVQVARSSSTAGAAVLHRVPSTSRLAVLAVAGAAGAAATLSPAATAAACLLTVLGAAVWTRPAIAAYLVIGLTPLVAGIDRGVALPVLRPNEALELFLGIVLATRGIVRARSGGVRLPRPDAVDWSLALLALTSSVLPLAVMTVRQREITTDDVLSSLALWKLVGIYLIVRWSVRSEAQVRRCLHVSVAAATLVAAVGVLQGVDLLGVRQLLAAYYAPFGDVQSVIAVPRGGSTLSLPAATADLMVMNLAVVTGLWVRDRRWPVVSAAVAALLVMATLAAGEFSSAIGLVVGIGTLVVVTGSVELLAMSGLLAVGGALTVWPVIARRLQGFQSASGLPVSWSGRLHNLRTYFWPQLSSHANVLLGVRPSARVRVDFHAAGYVWIESGYTWLIWAGGVPLLLSFLFFVRTTVTLGWTVARGHRDAHGAAATAALVGVIVTTVLMTLDPHLTYRGSADALFALIALTAGAAGRTAARRAGSLDVRAGQDHRQDHTVRSEP